jgi:hypothetical protein
MQELISPARAEILALITAFAVLIAASVYGYKTAGRRGLVAGFAGPLVYILWQVHNYVTRYDPKSGYFGLQSVAVLLAEVVVFILLGAALGRIWDGVVGKAAGETNPAAAEIDG